MNHSQGLISHAFFVACTHSPHSWAESPRMPFPSSWFQMQEEILWVGKIYSDLKQQIKQHWYALYACSSFCISVTEKCWYPDDLGKSRNHNISPLKTIICHKSIPYCIVSHIQTELIVQTSKLTKHYRT